MVVGLESFRKWFEGYEKEYVIIGGAACDLIMDREGLTFRATKDLDIVILVEMLTPSFGRRLWDYILEGEYKHLNKSTGRPQFYRFSSPKSNEFPSMIELFSREIDSISLPRKAVLTPLPIGDELSSLSAILLNRSYYDFLLEGQTIIEEMPILRPEYIIPFKAKAWLDLSRRAFVGEKIDSKNIRKHKNDVFRLAVLITEEMKIILPKEIGDDMELFIEAMDEESIDLKSIGVPNASKGALLKLLRSCYFELFEY